MRCPLCDAENDGSAEACFTCGRAFDALTQGSVLSGRYEVRRPLGSGGMGRVYEAFDRVLEEPVAIKVLRSELIGDPEVARRFIHEIKLARRISHARVCRIHEYGEADGLAFLSMEYISGLSLKAHLASRRPSLSERFDLSLQITEGLAAIHNHGIVHRDLKSANIMVDERGEVKILDFGIAKQAEGGAAGLTAGDRIFGTPEYMSPEQVEGGAADARSDIYALGCVIFEIFSGRPPFQGETPYATLVKHLKEPPPLDPTVVGLPGPLLPVLSRALAKDRNQRFRSAGELMAAIRAARDQEAATESGDGGGAPSLRSITPPPAGHVDTVTIFRRVATGGPRRWAWAVVGGGIAAAGIVLWVRESTPSAAGTAASSSLVGAPSKATGPVATTLPPEATTLAVPTTTVPVTQLAPRAGPRSEPAALTPAPTLRPAATPTPVPPAVTASDQALPSASRPSPQPGPSPTPAGAAAPPATAAAVPARGTLALMVVPQAEVLVDGQSIGVVSQRDILLAPGRHHLEVLHPDYQPLPRVVTIRAAEATTLILDLQEKGIRKAIDRKK
jgi:predicted Ser/Thr protein kinase